MRLEDVLNTLPDRVSVWDEDLRLTWSNAAGLAFTGRTAAELTGRLMSELVRGEAYADLGARARLALRGERQQWSGTSQPDGEPVAVDYSLNPVFLDGRVVAVSFTGTDASSRVGALREGWVNDVVAWRSELSLDDAARHVSEAAAALDETLDCVRGTAASDHELRERQARNARVRDALDALATALAALLEDTRVDGPVPPTGGPGYGDRLVPIELAVQRPAPREEGLVPAPSGMSEELLEAVLDSLPFPVTAWSRGSRSTFANRAAVRWVGHDVLGQQTEQVLGPRRWGRLQGYVERTLDGESRTLLRALPQSDGSTRFWQVHHDPQRTGGSVVGLVASAHDVTAEIEAGEALHVAQHRALLQGHRRRTACAQVAPLLQRLGALGGDIRHADDLQRLRELVRDVRATVDTLLGPRVVA